MKLTQENIVEILKLDGYRVLKRSDSGEVFMFRLLDSGEVTEMVVFSDGAHIPLIGGAKSTIIKDAIRKQKLRPCTFYPTNWTDEDMLREAKRKGYFHYWGQNYEEFTDGQGNFTVAIVEDITGQIFEVLPIHIDFTDIELDGR